MWMSVEEKQYVDSNRYNFICKIILYTEHSDLRNGHYNEPNYQLNNPDFVIDMLVQFFIRVSVNVLSVMKWKVDSTLQHKDVILIREVDNHWLDGNCQHNTKANFANEVDEVPVASIAFVYF